MGVASVGIEKTSASSSDGGAGLTFGGVDDLTCGCGSGVEIDGGGGTVTLACLWRLQPARIVTANKTRSRMGRWLRGEFVSAGRDSRPSWPACRPRPAKPWLNEHGLPALLRCSGK